MHNCGCVEARGIWRSSYCRLSTDDEIQV